MIHLLQQLHIGAVPRVEWSPAALGRAMRAREATVFTGAATGWAALEGERRWTPTMLARAPLGDTELSAFSSVAGSIFSVNAEAALRYEGSAPVEERVAMRDFWKRSGMFTKATLENFRASSTAALPPALQNAVSPRKMHRALLAGASYRSAALWRENAKRTAVEHAAFKESARTSHDVWLSTSGVRTWAHYDLQHNLYTVLHGKKTFALARARAEGEALAASSARGSPDAAAAAAACSADAAARRGETVVSPVGALASAERFWPTVHARQRQLRVMPSPSLGGADAAAWESVALRPGDTLYIPPFVVHAGTTAAKSSAIAFSACASSRAEGVGDALRLLKVPLEDPSAAGPAEEREEEAGAVAAVALRAYLDAVAVRAAPLLRLGVDVNATVRSADCASGAVCRAASAVARGSVADAVPRHWLAKRLIASSYAPGACAAATAARAPAAAPLRGACGARRPRSDSELGRDEQPAHAEAADALVATLAAIGADHDNRAHARLETWRVLRAWVEDLSSMIVGAKHLQSFLCECL